MTTIEKIRTEIEKKMEEKEREATQTQDDMECGISIGYKFALDIIDKYASEECDNDCEHCAWIECPKDDSDTISYNDDFATALEKISKYDDRKACEDAKSTKEVMRILTMLMSEAGKDGKLILSDAKAMIFDLPSVQPKAKTGRWKSEHKGYYRDNYVCSCCGFAKLFNYNKLYDYCPNCGAKMEEE